MFKNRFINSGHPACAGCGATIALNLMARHFPENVAMVVPASCTSVISGEYPCTTFNFPVIHSAFASGSAAAVGVYYGLKARYGDNFRVIVWAGDGGTFDIGIQSLSGALEKNIPFTYICYDNEAYMNTGIQRSSATPMFTNTTTTPEPNVKLQPKKNFLDIVIAHQIPYAATASISHIEDFEMKARKALTAKGSSVLHIFSPCPTGQGYAERYSVKIGRLAVESGVFPLYEYDNGTYKITYEPSFEGFDQYFGMQSRFKHIHENEMKIIRKNVDKQWETLRKKTELFAG